METLLITLYSILGIYYFTGIIAYLNIYFKNKNKGQVYLNAVRLNRDTEIDTEVDAQSNTEVDTASDTAVDTESDTEVGPESDTESDTEIDTEVDAQSNTEVFGSGCSIEH